jgi:class 3 adenylate cyclase
MSAVERSGANNPPSGQPGRPHWADMLRALREARAVTQDGWAAQLGVSRKTVQRWERGEAIPDTYAEQALVGLCRDQGLLRTYDYGPLRAVTLTPAWLRDLLMDARLGSDAKDADQPSAPIAPARPEAPPPSSSPALPSGTVTLLFTDIEGSTRLLHHLESGYAGVLAAHHGLLREAFRSHGGVEVDNQGDAFFVAFADVSRAVTAVLAAQRSLASHPWPEGGVVRVRMGLHSGTPVLTQDRYVGLDVHRAARICTAAHGGQVLLSRPLVDRVRDVLPAEVTLRDLGEHRLKDLPRPEQLFQLVAPDLPASFPPLRIPDTLDAQYDAVLKALTEGRLVLFLGSGVNSCGRKPASTWKPGQCDWPPSDGELAEHLAGNFDYPPQEPRDLTRVSQFVAITAGLGPLYDELHSLLDIDYVPTPLHRFLAALPGNLRAAGQLQPYQLIVTVNYDDALERAFAEAGEAIDLVTYIADGELRGRFVHRAPDGQVNVIDRPNEYLGVSLDQRSVILKIHGAVDRVHSDWDSFVITEDHYIEYLTRADVSSVLPVTLAAKLRRSHYLFLGYRLRDWNLRVILHRIWGQQRLAYRSWAFQPDLKPLEREFWQKREVDIFRVGLDECVSALHERVSTLQSAR